MLSIPKGKYPLWHSFGLQIESDLHLSPAALYHLQGPNGSGKSSFISQILIPKLRETDALLLHFEQDTHLQLQALRAWAAIFSKGTRINTEAEMVDFLLQDLHHTYQMQPKPVWIVADELYHLQRLGQLSLPAGLIYCAHHQELQGSRPIHFEPISSTQSRVYA